MIPVAETTVRAAALSGVLANFHAVPVEVRQWVGAELLYALRVLPRPCLDDGGLLDDLITEQLLARRAARTTTTTGGTPS